MEKLRGWRFTVLERLQNDEFPLLFARHRVNMWLIWMVDEFLRQIIQIIS